MRLGISQYEKVSCHFDAKIVSAGKTYSGCVEEIFEQGPEYYLVTSVISPPKDFIPAKTIQMNFLIASDEICNLSCRSLWFINDTQKLKTIIGMKIIDPFHRCRNLIGQYISENSSGTTIV